MKLNKIGVYIGRFQPAHDGHIQAIAHVAAQVTTLAVLIGSANACRSIKNPWTFSERKRKIMLAMRSRGIENVVIYPINDHKYNDPLWISEVNTLLCSEVPPNAECVLFGHSKDGNDYLNWFPELKFKEIPAFAGGVSATQVRQKMFEDVSIEMPKQVYNDWKYFQKERELFSKYPYPETLSFNCADVVVECLGHILLIQRGAAPGEGTWALPGGFKNQNETFLECALRELREETNLRVPEKVLRGSIVSTKLFDSPTRGNGIPRITLAVYIRIQPDADGKLPKANGSDDAASAEWFTLNAVLDTMSLFDDHSAIISDMTGVNPVPAFIKQS